MKSLFRPLALATLVALPGMASADMQQNLGPLSGTVELGESDAWKAEDKGGWFMLTNTDAPGAVRYYWSEVPEDRGSDYTVEVNLVTKTESANPSFAGLLYNFKESDSYFGVTIGSDGAGYLFVRSPDGFQTHKLTKVSAKNDGTDWMRAHVTATNVRFELNGAKMAEMDNPNGFSPKLGIIAVGEGVMGFTGFAVKPAQ